MEMGFKRKAKHAGSVDTSASVRKNLREFVRSNLEKKTKRYYKVRFVLFFHNF